MAKLPRPPRLFFFLTLIILVSLGLTAYLINFPVVLIVVGEVAVMLVLAWRLTRVKQPQQVTQTGPSDENPRQSKAESSARV